MSSRDRDQISLIKATLTPRNPLSSRLAVFACRIKLAAGSAVRYTRDGIRTSAAQFNLS
jgi:hypothetical protein